MASGASKPLSERARPWLSALGLRGRIAGALLVTAVGALAVAAVGLLGPLEHSLRNAEKTTLEQQVNRGSVALFNHLDPTYAYYYRTARPPAGCAAGGPSGASDVACDTWALGKWTEARLRAAEDAIGKPIGASEVALLGYPRSPNGRGFFQIATWPDPDTTLRGDPANDAAKAWTERPARSTHTLPPVYSIASIGNVEYAQAAIPFTTPGPGQRPYRWVLIVRKSVVEVNTAVSAVRTAFGYAALAALGLTLLLGIPLSGRIVRRLRRLRQAALQLAQEGPVVDVPLDRARDEVGDLARTFALMQEQLRQQEEARRAFVATASHELRTPLASLDGMLELLDEDLRGGSLDLADAHELLERARAQSKRLGRLAADLLDLSRLDAQVELRSEPVELSELSRAVLAEFEVGTAERGVDTVLDDQGPVWALGDPGGVARIVRILVDNAVRMSPPGAEVRVRLRAGQAASLSVCDRGPGVPPEERELIFERFKRGRETAGQAGFGLGLAIGRELAERMGGELVLEPADGPGARFTLRLPVAMAPEIEPVAVG